MTWVTWRQFRAQAVVAAAGLVLLVIAFATTGPGLAHLYDASGLGGCHAPADCTRLTADFLTQMKADAVYPALYFVALVAVAAAPGLIGVFWGAPLIARELEAGTLPLVWSQTVTRTRWTAAKLGLLALAAMAATGLLSFVITWWSEPIDRAGGFPAGTTQLGRFSAQVFDSRGTVPMAYAAFALVLGAAVGAAVRRTVPAMAITLAVFAAVQILTPQMIRPHLLRPTHSVSAPLSVTTLEAMVVNHSGHIVLPVNLPGAWIVANQTITSAGQEFVLPADPHCAGGKQQCIDWLAGQHLRQFVTYQPADRYWAFQWYETVLFLALALALIGACLWRVRRL